MLNLKTNKMNKKMQIPMDGKIFNECWAITDVEVNDNDDVVVNFINDRMVNIFVNENKIWSIITSIV
tara:strand:- start:414 stop:614 length:201 start_codon:yes stop_codon:yes gene_type:complete